MATLHANNANQALERIISFFPTDAEHGLLLGVPLNLVVVVSQRLIPVKIKKCVAAVEVSLKMRFAAEGQAGGFGN